VIDNSNRFRYPFISVNIGKEIRVKATLISAVVMLWVMCGCISIHIPLGAPKGELEEQVVEEAEGFWTKNRILILPIDGVIMEKESNSILFPSENTVSEVRERLKKAKEDSRVKAVILRIDSPGGTVTGSDTIHNEIRKFKEETGKKVIAWFGSTAASGGYYVSAGADKIVAHPTTVTGSIGVILQLATIEKLLEKIGVTPVTIKSGERKDAGSPFRPILPEEKEYLQNIINHLHERFVQTVAQGRKMPLDEVRKLADGRIFTAEEALQAKLVDSIGYLDDAVALAKKESGVSDAIVVMYERPYGYRGNYYALGSTPEIVSALQAFLANSPSPFMYLWIPGK
jgi:protease-4